MRKLLLLCLLVIVPGGYFQVMGGGTESTPAPTTWDLYTEIGLAGIVDFAVFQQAVDGYNLIKPARRGIITLFDLSKPSTEERLYVLDLEHRRLLFRSLCAHGKASGELYAGSFSNKPNSHKTSLGFFLTGKPYNGRNGYSLALDGLEKGINDRVRERGVVIHGADYCNPAFLDANGRLGRSLGCPAVPEALNKAIIDTIKGSTLLYIYAPDKAYMTQSTILRSKGAA
jgi:hypothetical protein